MLLSSKSTRGFYIPEIHGANIPGDAVEISEQLHQQLLDAQSSGKRIDWSGDYPVAIDPPAFVPIVPSSVSPAQARLALLGASMLGQVEAIVAAADQATQIAWNNASVIERDSPTVAALSAALGLTGAQLDSLFTTAAGIRV